MQEKFVKGFVFHDDFEDSLFKFYDLKNDHHKRILTKITNTNNNQSLFKKLSRINHLIYVHVLIIIITRYNKLHIHLQKKHLYKFCFNENSNETHMYIV